MSDQQRKKLFAGIFVGVGLQYFDIRYTKLYQFRFIYILRQL